VIEALAAWLLASRRYESFPAPGSSSLAGSSPTVEVENEGRGGDWPMVAAIALVGIGSRVDQYWESSAVTAPDARTGLFPTIPGWPPGPLGPVKAAPADSGRLSAPKAGSLTLFCKDIKAEVVCGAIDRRAAASARLLLNKSAKTSPRRMVPVTGRWPWGGEPVG
jgi:hypothetical protein